MKKKMEIHLVSKIKKITIKRGKEPLYLVKWYKSQDETWEPVHNFPDDVNTYPGYKESLNNLWKVRTRKEKDAIYSIIELKKQKFENQNIFI